MVVSQSPTAANAVHTQIRPHLVLHFDINETILVGDEAGGDSREDCLNKILAKSAFVKCSCEKQDADGMEVFEPSQWWDGQLIGEDDGDQDPAETQMSMMATTGANKNPPDLYTEWEWPKDCCPYYRTAMKKRSKTFTNHHGKIYRSIYEKMDGVMTPRDDAFSHIVPSFFHTLEYLSKHYGTDWSLVLRTFGSDLSAISEAISLFAQGKHPDFPDFVDERLVSSCLWRGRWIQDTDETTFTYQLLRPEDDVVVARGDAEVLRLVEDQSFCGIQDHYEHWDRHNCRPWAGKPVWISLRSDDEEQFLHILFDDNIHNLDYDSIAGIRQEIRPGVFESLSGSQVQELQGRHLVRVPTLRVILEDDWFLRSIQRAQELFGEKGTSDVEN